jgi:hypothetical protein
MQGIHAPEMLLVIDEAAEVEQSIYGALSSLMTSETAHMVMIGNPTVTDNPFHYAFTKNASLWHRITIRAQDTPNVQAGYEVVPGLVTQQWIDDRILEYGEDSPYIVSRVYADFPSNIDTNYIPLDWLEAADKRRAEESEDEDGGWVTSGDVWEAGVDAARFGEDKSTLCIRRNMTPVLERQWNGLDTMELAGHVMAELEDYPKMRAIKVDTIGLGSGVADRLREEKYPVIDVNVSAPSSDPKQFLNLRHELWWQLRSLFQHEQLCGPIHPGTIEQLSSVRFKYDSKHTKPIVESKDSMRNRGLGSPDQAEAFMLAFTNPVGGRKRGKSVAPVAIGQVSNWRGRA